MRAHVLATATLEDQAHMHIGIARLFPVEDGTAGAEIVTGIPAVDTIDRVLSQIPFRRGFLHRLAAQLFQLQLIDAARRFEIEIDRSGVLANRE